MKKLLHLPTQSAVFTSTHHRARLLMYRVDINKKHFHRSTKISFYQRIGGLPYSSLLQAFRNCLSVQDTKLSRQGIRNMPRFITQVPLYNSTNWPPEKGY